MTSKRETPKELMTAAQRRVARRQVEVVAMYREYRKEWPDMPMARIFEAIAAKKSLSAGGVRSILVRAGEPGIK